MRSRKRLIDTKRLVFLGIYMLVSNLIIFSLSLNPQGQEGREPILILSSWAWVAYSAFGRTIFPRTLVLSFFFYELFFFIYLSLESALVSLLERISRIMIIRRYLPLLAPIFIHLLGTWLLLARMGYFDDFSTYNSKFRYPAVAVISLLIAVYYRWLDWRLLRQQPYESEINHQRHEDPKAG